MSAMSLLELTKILKAVGLVTVSNTELDDFLYILKVNGGNPEVEVTKYLLNSTIKLVDRVYKKERKL